MDLPSNSRRVTSQKKTEKKDISEKPKEEKIITGEVISRKPPLARRFKSIFMGGDARGTVRHVVSDVLLPAARDMFFDAVTTGTKRMVYGDKGPTRSSMVDQNRPKFSYSRPESRYSSSASTPSSPSFFRGSSSTAPPSRRDTNEIVFRDREDAARAVDRMNDILETYEVVSLADLHGIMGMAATYQDNNWGWKTLAGTDIHAVREGWMLYLPPMEPIS